jgi:hypothetical protein
VIPGGGGLAIWHIDDNAGYNTQGFPGQAGWPGNGNHYRVALLQADGDYDLERNVNRGDSGDLYRAGFVAEIGPHTSPSTDAYQGGTVYQTGHVITGISSSDSSMQFTLTVPESLPDVATADYQAVYGQPVSGNYSNTHTQDNVYQAIDEKESGGRPSSRHDRLQHIWSFNVSSGNSILFADAHRLDAGDADALFYFEWSISPSGPWTPMFTVTNTADDDSYQQFDLGPVAGTIYIQARDDNRSSGQRSEDRLLIDHMYIDEGTPPSDPPAMASAPSPGDGNSGESVSTDLDWTTGSGSTETDVYFGTNPVPGLAEFLGTQTGSGYDLGTLDPLTTYYWRIDETNVIGTTPGNVWTFTTADVATSMHVNAIDLGTASAGRGRKYGRAQVTVVDSQGSPVQGATVSGSFGGTYNESIVAVTNASGVATLTTTGTGKKGIAYNFCVQNVSHGSLSYDDSSNVETCDTY